MRVVVAFIGLLVGVMIVLLGLYQAFAAVSLGAEPRLIRVYGWSIVTVLGVYFSGYAGVSYIYSTTRPSRPVPPQHRPSEPSHSSKSRQGRRDLSWSR